MRVAITGDRRWDDRTFAVYKALLTLDPATDFVILGDAEGADTIARLRCGELGLRHRVHNADWRTYHRAAGPLRNAVMLDDLEDGDPDERREVWYFHDDLPGSKGTKNCVEQARKRGLTVRDGQLSHNG
jgi:YspA, cpYpsA-related SLOG family